MKEGNGALASPFRTRRTDIKVGSIGQVEVYLGVKVIGAGAPRIGSWIVKVAGITISAFSVASRVNLSARHVTCTSSISTSF